MADLFTDVFISHIHEEAEVALALKRYLEIHVEGAIGRRPMVYASSDKWQQSPGENWFERIKRELKSAKIVILLLSEKSLPRPWVNFEAGGAFMLDKLVIPACCGNLHPGNMVKPYSDLTAIDLNDDPYHLLRAVIEHLSPLSLLPLVSPGDETAKPLNHALRNLKTT